MSGEFRHHLRVFAVVLRCAPMFTQLFRITLAGLIISAASAGAAPSVALGPARIQGVVKDSNGQPVAGAEVHIQAKDGSGFQKIVRSDSNGNYGVSGLPKTDYEVVLFVNGKVKASINNTKVFADKPTQLDFKLTGKFAANTTAKKKTHMVYVPGETGSHLGGRWVEVDDTAGSSSAATAGDNVKRVGGEAVRSLQRNSGTTGGGN